MTVLLHEQVGNLATIGSGTLINHGNRYFLVTASHVVADMKNPNIIFHTEGNSEFHIRLRQLVLKDTILWSMHKIADLSMIEIRGDSELLKQFISKWSFKSKFILNADVIIPRNVPLTMFGYPFYDITPGHFSPLTLTANMASGLINQKRFDNGISCMLFYLNVQSLKGCSGGGVFTSIAMENGNAFIAGDATYLAGVVHGRKGDGDGLQIAAITPSFYVLELLMTFL